ncbi:MAG TPA: hypothetical protein VGF48_16065 [Thermoanaerobaculia bacterium]
MSEEQRVCVGCGDSEEMSRLETCSICRKAFCPDCAHRGAHGRRFCSSECARNYYFSGEIDDNEDAELHD